MVNAAFASRLGKAHCKVLTLISPLEAGTVSREHAKCLNVGPILRWPCTSVDRLNSLAGHGGTERLPSWYIRVSIFRLIDYIASKKSGSQGEERVDKDW